MRTVIAALCVCALGSGMCIAQSPSHKKEMQAIRAVIEENFRTSNNEDISGCMATMTPHMPNREEFVAQLKEFFEVTDVYIRLVDLQFVSAEMSDYGPLAIVRVTQETLTRGDEELPYSEFRTRSAMLPPWEVCEFDLVMHKIRGKWLVHKIASNVREAQLPERHPEIDARTAVH
jgi:hypothetical protein